jgi:hypothetical protein
MLTHRRARATAGKTIKENAGIRAVSDSNLFTFSKYNQTIKRPLDNVRGGHVPCDGFAICFTIGGAAENSIPRRHGPDVAPKEDS